MLFDDINIDIENYADDTISYPYQIENEKIIRLPEKNINKFLDWFSDNFSKANPNKCKLLIGTDENVTLKIKNETLLTVLIKNCLVKYSIIGLISMNKLLYYAESLPEFKCSCKSCALYELSIT